MRKNHTGVQQIMQTDFIKNLFKKLKKLAENEFLGYLFSE